MNLQSQLDEANLQSRSKQLDIREQSVAEREQLLDDTEAKIRLTVLGKQIEAKEKTLDVLADKVTKTEKHLQSKTQEVDRQVTSLYEALNSKRASLDNLEAKKQSLKAQLAACLIELESAEHDIKERNNYLVEQESTVNSAIADWNSQLVGFQHEADAIEQEKNKHLAQVTELEQDKVAMEDALTKVEAELTALEDKYEARATDYKAKLRELDTELSQRQQEVATLKIDQDMRDKNLKAREKSLTIKSIAQDAKEQELGQKERKLRGDYSRAGLDFD